MQPDAVLTERLRIAIANNQEEFEHSLWSMGVVQGSNPLVYSYESVVGSSRLVFLGANAHLYTDLSFDEVLTALAFEELLSDEALTAYRRLDHPEFPSPWKRELFISDNNDMNTVPLLETTIARLGLAVACFRMFEWGETHKGVYEKMLHDAFHMRVSTEISQPGGSAPIPGAFTNILYDAAKTARKSLILVSAYYQGGDWHGNMGDQFIVAHVP